MGNLTEQSVGEILVEKEYRKFEMSLHDERVTSLCRRCGSAISKNGDGRSFYDVYDKAKYLAVNATRVGRILDLIGSGIPDAEILDVSTDSARLLRRILDAGTVFIFGLGKLFCDRISPPDGTTFSKPTSCAITTGASGGAGLNTTD